MKKKNWLSTVFKAAAPCKGKLTISVILAIISVFSGIIPYIGVYKILELFLEGTPNMRSILPWCMVCILAYLIKIIFHSMSTVLSHISAYTILEQIRLAMINRMMKAPLGKVLSETKGNLKSIIIDRVETIELPLAHVIPEGISNTLLPIAVFIYLISINWKMALIAIATIPIASLSFGIMIKTFNEKYARYMEANNNVNSIIVEYVNGIEVIKAFSKGDESYEKFSKAVNSFKEYTLEWYRSTWKLMNFGSAVLPSVLLGTLPMGMWLYSKGELMPAEFAICIILSLGLMAPLMWFTVLVNDIKSIEYAVNEASKLMQMEELVNKEVPVKLNNYDIELSNVSFSYDGKEKVLEDVNINIPERGYYALVGPSGGGKSTVARLIARFWDVDKGHISIGKKNIKDISLEQLSSMVSFVTQDNFLFNCSLMENIRLGNPKATDEQVYKISKLAQCDEFIREFPKGYDTMAGDAGNRLSGGEKQRIAIARAMLKDAPIVILDEATAFTDPENEDKLQEAISKLTKGKTLLVIAHRLSTIKGADKIIVMENGKVVEMGNQEYLLSNCITYKNMWETHIGSKKWVAGRGKAYV